MAEKFKACSVDGCNGNAHYTKGGVKGICIKHYKRLTRHGDTSKSLKLANGETARFYHQSVVPFDGDGCLLWPYGGTSSGYGLMTFYGKQEYVHRAICEEANGPPPTPQHEASHSCGNGHLGCVSRKHLSWKTPKENSADKIIHGTHNRGERSNFAKLTESQAREILALRGLETQASIARRYGVHRVTVHDIHTRRNWAWLQP